jgi:molecular chaperone DnaJ
MNDYYEILGIKKEATQEEVDVAYRSLARKWHPDMHPDDQKEVATEQFKRVAEAYEILGNPEKRSRYDNRGWTPNVRLQADFVDSVFANFFSEGRAAIRGTRARVQITLKEAFAGCTKTVELQQQRPCAACNTSGYSKWSQCKVCGGSGTRVLHQAAFVVRSSCSACNGAGQMPIERCSKCSGQGRIRGDLEKIPVEIPSGIEEGVQIRVPDKGLDGGDLYVVVSIAKDKTFKREGNNLFVELETSYIQLALGGICVVESLDGSKVEVKIAPGTQVGTRLRIKGQGMPMMQSPQRGDLFVTMSIFVPKKLSKKHRELLEKLRDLDDN